MTASNEGKPTLGFVGLGAMGFGMAANLVQSGVQVTGFDLNPAARERFAALSPDARAAGNVAETCEGQSRLWVMVATPAQADSVIFESDALQTLPRGAMICLFSTLPPAYVTGLPARLGAAGRSDVRLVDCPVSGGVVGAAGGKLTVRTHPSHRQPCNPPRQLCGEETWQLMSAAFQIMIGAELETYEEIQPELRAVSAPGRVFHCGALGAASTVKMYVCAAPTPILGRSVISGSLYPADLSSEAQSTAGRSPRRRGSRDDGVCQGPGNLNPRHL